jgi:GSH-dependent disulfide-bond oxidoreductase
MLTLYTAATTNGRKPLIMLEEIGLAYDVRAVDLAAGAQHESAFRALNPMERIPVLVDDDAGTVFESNAILWHLATLTGRLLGEGRDSLRVMQFLFMQSASVVHPLGNWWRLRHRTEKPDPGELAYHEAEGIRVLTALEAVMTGAKYFAGSFSIADIAFIPQLKREMDAPEHAGQWPALRAWLDRCLARPAVEKGLTMRVG